MNILENDLVTTFTWDTFWNNTISIFSSTTIGNYNPLSIFTFGIENMVFGIESPEYWHLNNLILHLICIYCVFRICTHLGLNLFGASICTLLFAVHPMRVESVAWITERKDVLYGALFLGAMLQYIIYKKTNQRKRLWWMTLFFVLSLFAKIQAVTFPIVMILVDYLLDKDLKWKLIISKWHYFLMSLTVGILGIYILNVSGSLSGNAIFPLWQRIFIGSFSFIVYLIKSVIPYQMLPLYPYPSLIPAYFYPTIVVAPLYLWMMFWTWKKDYKEITFGLAFFLVNIIFLLQILGAGQGFIADRFTYIAYLGLFFIFGHLLDQAYKKTRYKQWTFYGSIVVIAVFGCMTFLQNRIWKNSETLWSHVLKYTTKSTLPYGNRANYLRDQGRYQEAIRDYNASLKLKPNQAGTLNSRAKLYFSSSNNRDTLLLALADYNQAIALAPDEAEYYVNKGATLARLGNMNEALIVMNKGLEINPEQLSGYSNRSILYSRLGQYQNALADIHTYLRYRPNDADFWYESGNLKAALGNPAEGIMDIDRALSYQKNGVYYYRKCEILLSLNRFDEARIALQNAQSLGFTNISQDVRNRLFPN
jgi:Flp pilus assembly protein TadD